MERQKSVDVDVGDAIAVGHEERLVTHAFLDAFDAAASHGVQAGVHHRDLPRLGDIAMDLDFAAIGEIEGYIAIMQRVVSKILFYNFLLVAGANNEIVDSVMGENLHDVPKDRHAADLDHRFRFQVGLFPNTSTKAPSKNY